MVFEAQEELFAEIVDAETESCGKSARGLQESCTSLRQELKSPLIASVSNCLLDGQKKSLP